MQQDTPNIAPPKPFEVDLRVLAIGAESVPWLSALIETARDDLQPRDFPERHLVDEMAISKWRLLRIYGMEKSVYEHQLAGFRPTTALMTDGQPVEPNEDLYHLAGAHSHDHDGIILAALSRLEARFHRQFYAALRMLMALRRFNPFSPNPTEKEPSCEPSKSLSDLPTTKSPNKLKPDSGLWT